MAISQNRPGVTYSSISDYSYEDYMALGPLVSLQLSFVFIKHKKKCNRGSPGKLAILHMVASRNVTHAFNYRQRRHTYVRTPLIRGAQNAAVLIQTNASTFPSETRQIVTAYRCNCGGQIINLNPVSVIFQE